MLIVITLAAFAFARLEFRGKNIAFALFLSLMMIPNELVIITNFVTITNLDLRNSFLGLILPSVTSVFYIYLLRENFAQIPADQLGVGVKGGDDAALFVQLILGDHPPHPAHAEVGDLYRSVHVEILLF